MVAAGAGALSRLVVPTLASMGYELVDIEFAGAGLLRVTIDVADRSRAVLVEDCERVSDQVGRMFEVEGVDYSRLEVSSPGLDRPLKRAEDFDRFVGEKVALRLRHPVNGRRQFTGTLQRGGDGRADEQAKAAPDSGGWVLLYSDAPEPGPVKPGRRSPSHGLSGRVASVGGGASGRRVGAAKRTSGAVAVGDDGAAVRTGAGVPDADVGVSRLEFTFDQVDKARLVPNLGF